MSSEPTEAGDSSGRGGAGRPGDADAPRGRRGGCLLFLIVAGGFFFLLRDFTSTVVASLLAPLGAALAIGGGYLAIAALPHVLESPWYAGVWVLGLAMLAGAAATLSPAAPGAWLAQASPLWGLLDTRTAHLEAAIEAGDLRRARTLAQRGLGDPVPRNTAGTPLLHRAEGTEMLALLLDAGLDPDARGERGQTLLMRSHDPQVTRLLLEAGADPDARDDHGFTALMHRRDAPLEQIALLLEAGADVHAVSDSGRTVADLVHGPGRALLERHAGGRPLRETGGVAPRGLEEWLVADPGPIGRPDASAVVRNGDPLRPGDTGSVSILVDNPTAQGRVVELAAELDNAILFVAASHGGQVDEREGVGPTSTVRWPWLALPAGARGRLDLEVLARPDDVVPGVYAGDWSLRVRVVDVPERSEHTLQLMQEREGPPALVEWDDPSAFVGPLLFVGLVAVFWLVFGRRRRGESGSDQRNRIARMVSGGCALLCLLVAGNLFWSMAEPYVAFDEASCEVLDHRVVATLVEGSRLDRRGRKSRSTMQGHPVAAVAIATGGQPLVTAGWSTSQASHSVAELRAAPIGSTQRCWIDPSDAHRFTMLRTPPLGGIIGLAMLLCAGLPLALIAAFFGRGGTKPGD